jgi:hypothetical protein
MISFPFPAKTDVASPAAAAAAVGCCNDSGFDYDTQQKNLKFETQFYALNLEFTNLDLFPSSQTKK